MLAALAMMVNIRLINIFYSITFGAERTAIFILGCMLLRFGLLPFLLGEIILGSTLMAS